MLIGKFITVPLVWLFTILVCSLRPYSNIEFEFWGINDYTLFTALLYLLSTFTIQIILSRQLKYDFLHSNARAISFCTGLFFIIIAEIARQLSGYTSHEFGTLTLYTAACLTGNLVFNWIYR